MAEKKAQKVVPVPTLRFLTGERSGDVVRLADEEATIGRRKDNTYVIPDPRVSRVHARVTKEAGSLIITDLGSSGGTKINGAELSGSKAIEHGDRIRFANVECIFEDPAAAADDDDQTMVFELPKVDSGPHLSPRQQQVLELMAEGMTNTQIGDQLGVTERTVKAYAQELYDKLGVRNRAGAVAEAHKMGML